MSDKATILNDLVSKKEEADKAYFIYGQSIMSDEAYDTLVAKITELDPLHPTLFKSGSKANTDSNLVFTMGGMAKAHYRKGLLGRWIKNKLAEYGEFTIVISPKLDGIALALIYKNGTLVGGYKKGNRDTGTDVMKALSFSSVPKQHMVKDTLVLRAEAIMDKSLFSSRYSIDYKNARNLVSGIYSTTNPVLAGDVNIVIHDVIYSESSLIKNRDEDSYNFIIDNIKSNGFETVEVLKTIHITQSNFNEQVVEDILSETYKMYREKGTYEIDGLVLTIDRPSSTKIDGDNIPYSIAFKMNNYVQAVVEDVEFNLSKLGIWIPRIILEPVDISGVTITGASGHNLKRVIDTGIGKGSIVLLTRSGEVIPHIHEVVYGTGDIQLPPNGTWEGVNYVVSDLTEADKYRVLLTQCLHCKDTLRIMNFGESTITDLIDSGEIQTVADFLTCSLNTLEQKEGYTLQGVYKLRESRKQALSSVSVDRLMKASCCFPMLGETRLRKILTTYPNLEEDNTIKANAIYKLVSGIPDLGPYTAEVFANKYETWLSFYALVKSSITVIKPKTYKGEICLTLTRDAELIQYLESKGYEITKSISKATTAVVTIEGNPNSSKIEKAKRIGIPIFTISQAFNVF